jgi:hypothetical protein
LKLTFFSHQASPASFAVPGEEIGFKIEHLLLVVNPLPFTKSEMQITNPGSRI